jgi:glycosyltransferase involved in cell wall biosynthesis
MRAPRLSILVASHNGRDNIGLCLSALQGVLKSGDAEIIVVDNSSDGSSEIVARQFAGVKLVQASKDKFIPQLWEIGIQQARCEIVATTTAHFVPEKDWVPQILKAHENAYAGIGGAIENEAGGGLVSRAIYFCRYSAYMLPFEERRVNDFAADNASYKREVLDKYEAARRNGFWEAAIHGQMVADGHELSLNPGIVVRHHKSFSFAGFMEQRFFHGRQYGTDRAKQFSTIRRAAYAVMSPLIPFIYLSRMTRRVMARRKNIALYLSALPVITAFLISWSAGELLGYLSVPVEKELSRRLETPGVGVQPRIGE